MGLRYRVMDRVGEEGEAGGGGGGGVKGWGCDGSSLACLRRGPALSSVISLISAIESSASWHSL